jgi:PST family polysaccharide transporter
MTSLRIRAVFQNGLARSIGSLYLIQGVSYIVPLLTLPWLARVLGPSGLGMLAFMQGFGSCVTLLVEYGFRFSATQSASVHRHSPGRLSELIAGVQGGKVVLAVVVTAVSFALLPWIAPLRGHETLFAAGIFMAVGQAFGMVWYFLAVEQMPVLAVLESVLRLVSAVAVLGLVKTPADGWKVLAFQGAAAWIAAIVGLIVALRSVPFCWPTPALVKAALSSGRSALFFRIAETSYTSCNALLLGFFAPPGVVGLYAGADKIARNMLIALLDPVQRSVYPGVAKALSESRAQAAAMIRVSARATISVSLLVSAVLFVAAPQVSRILLGPGFDSAVPALRILLLVPVAVACKWSIGLNWMVPLGEAKSFNTLIAGSAVLHLVLTALLVPIWGHAGMAAAVAVTEIVIPACVYILLRRRDLDPFQITAEEEPLEFQHDTETEVHCY